MRRSQIFGPIAICVATLTLGGSGAAVAQRVGRPAGGRIQIPREFFRESERLDVEPHGTSKRERRNDPHETGRPGVLTRLFDGSRAPSAWERAGSEAPREEARFRAEVSDPGSAPRRPGGTGGLHPDAAVILPKGGAFRDVFGRNPGKAEAERMRDYEKEFRDAKVDVLGESGMGGEELRDWVRARARAGGRPVVVIGHSKFVGEKQVLVLPDGVVDVAEIHQWAAEAGSECVVLTCDGPDLGLTSRIRYEDALAVWKGALHAAELPELSDIVGAMCRARLERGARAIDLTVSAPADRPLWGAAPPSAAAAGETITWSLRMARPDRTLLVVFLIAAGLGLLHHAMYRAGLDPVGFRPVDGASFVRAMALVVRHLKAHTRAGLVIAGVTLLLAVSAYLTGSELFMDWEETNWGARWPVHAYALTGVSLASLAGGVHLSEPRRSWLGSLSHGVSGMLVGATAAWFCVVALLTICAAILGIVLTVLFGPLGLIIDRTWEGFTDPLPAAVFCGLGFGAFFGCFMAIGGLVVGCRSALEGESVYRSVFSMLKYVHNSAYAPQGQRPRPHSGPGAEAGATRVFVADPGGGIRVEPARPSPPDPAPPPPPKSD